MNSFLRFSAFASLTLFTGCLPVAFMGAASTVTTSASEERGLKGVWSDAEIKAKIQMEWMGHKSELMNDIDVVVREGRVLLTGEVDSPQTQIEAVRLAWKVPGVVEIIDETTVGNETGFMDYTQDYWITGQLKSQIFVDDDIRSLNYNIQTVKGVVYLMGIAQDKKELNKVTHYASHMKGVKKVVSYVKIKDQKKNKESHKRIVSQRKKRSSSKSSPSSYQGREEQNYGSDLSDQPPMVRNNEIKVHSLEAPNTGSSFQ